MYLLLSLLQLVSPHDPILDQPSRPLTQEEILAPSTQNLFDSMISFAKGEQSDQQKYVLVGLAAPQIGHSIRVILVDTKADGKGFVSTLRLYINPEIVSLSQDTNEHYEGCFSTGKVLGIVSRPSTITITALDRSGQPLVETHTGYVARIFQHEIDHLNGIRFPDRIPASHPLHIVYPHEMYLYRNQQGWRNWQVTIPQPSWKEHMDSRTSN